MAYRSDPAFLVLHALRLKGVAPAAAVARVSGMSVGEVERLLDELAGAGQVEHREGRPAGWTLSAAGAGAHARLVADDLGASAARTAVEEAHRRFLELNPELLGACTAWQLRELEGGRVLNDHADPGYDRIVVERLVAVHDLVVPVLEALGQELGRFCPYAARLQEALDRVVAGEGEWFTRALLDSYHTVWFELHQDLLETLALERGAESVTV